MSLNKCTGNKIKACFLTNFLSFVKSKFDLMNITICQKNISFWTHTNIYIYFFLLFRIVKAYKFLFKNKVGLRIQITTSLLSFIALSVMIQMPLGEFFFFF